MPSAISWVRLVVGSVNRSKAIQASTFAMFAVRIGSACGKKGLVLYLKTAQVMLQQGLSGSQLKANSRSIGKTGVSASSDGLPRVIPRFARELIRRGDLPTLRLWLTFFGTYRVIEYVGIPNTSTITDPGKSLKRAFLREWGNFVWFEFLPRISYFTGWKMRGLIANKVLSRPEPMVIHGASADSLKLETRNEDGVVVKTTYDSSFASRFSSANH